LTFLMAAPVMASSTSLKTGIDPNAWINKITLEHVLKSVEEGLTPYQEARYINPNWGSGTGFHTVHRRDGSSYLRSNPDGLCWNNKYGCN
jgi:hypothetical protein